MDHCVFFSIINPESINVNFNYCLIDM